MRTLSQQSSTRDIIDPHNPRWEQVSDALAPPYAAICKLATLFPTGHLIRGSGWFAGQQLVLTAGHCVFDHRLGGWAKRIDIVFPGGAAFVVAQKEHILSAEGWTTDAFSWADIGGLVLPQPESGGWLGSNTMSLMQDQTVRIAGYPGGKDGMWMHVGRLLGQEGRRIFYDVDVDDGQSGAPILVKAPGGWVAVGLHTHGKDDRPDHLTLPLSNGGLAFDASLLAIARSWGAQR